VFTPLFDATKREICQDEAGLQKLFLQFSFPGGIPSHRPYWRRAHRDWRLWAIVILMLAAMAVYLMTGDLRWPIHAQPQSMVPTAG
jgi:hypothetical protein